MAFEPAPPATAPLTASTPGLDWRKAANSVSSAAASDPDVHQATTSRDFVLVVALGGWLPPQAAPVSAAAATAATTAARVMPGPRRAAAGGRDAPAPGCARARP